MLKWKPSISERAVKAVPPDLTETSPQVTSLGEAAVETRHSTNLTTVFSVQSGRLRPECVASLDPDSTWTPRDRSTAVPPLFSHCGGSFLLPLSNRGETNQECQERAQRCTTVSVSSLHSYRTEVFSFHTPQLLLLQRALPSSKQQL